MIEKAELEEIGAYVKTNIVGWLDELKPRREPTIPINGSFYPFGSMQWINDSW